MLGGGITNHNFKVSLDDATYVLRIAGRDTNLLGIDRRAEYEASLAAAAVGVGPEVIELRRARGLPRDPVHRRDARAGGGRWAVRTRSRGSRSRSAPFMRGRPSPPDSTRSASSRSIESARQAHGIPTPAAYERAKRIADEIERARGPVAERAVSQRSPERELHRRRRAGSGSSTGSTPGWATSSSTSPTSRPTTSSTTPRSRSLLRAYFGEVRAEHERNLRLMRFMSDFREAMWGVLQQAVSELDFDFAGYAQRHFDRLERNRRGSGFRGRALG